MDEIEEIIKQVKMSANIMLDWMVEGETIRKFAIIFKKLYDELITQGFTEEQAMQIVVNYSPTIKG